MPEIRIDERTLLERRDIITNQILQPLVEPPSGQRKVHLMCSTVRGGGAQKIVLSAHGAGMGDSHDYHNARFQSFTKSFLCTYYEVWETVSQQHFILNRAYLHLFMLQGRHDEKETPFLFVHCDPLVSDEADHAVFRQGPHLHMKFADAPLPDAHIALNRGHLTDILSSAEAISLAFTNATHMLREEVLLLDWAGVVNEYAF